MSLVATGFGSAMAIIRELARIDLGRMTDRTKIDQALQSLREIYFLKPEVKKALARVAENGESDPDILSLLKDGFDRMPAEIGIALDYLDSDRFSGSRLLFIEELERMDNIRFTKISLRVRLRSLFYPENFPDRKKHIRANALEVLNQIGMLNSDIRKLEKALLSARDASGATSRARGRKPSQQVKE